MVSRSKPDTATGRTASSKRAYPPPQRSSPSLRMRSNWSPTMTAPSAGKSATSPMASSVQRWAVSQGSAPAARKTAAMAPALAPATDLSSTLAPPGPALARLASVGRRTGSGGGGRLLTTALQQLRI